MKVDIKKFWLFTTCWNFGRVTKIEFCLFRYSTHSMDAVVATHSTFYVSSANKKYLKSLSCWHTPEHMVTTAKLPSSHCTVVGYMKYWSFILLEQFLVQYCWQSFSNLFSIRQKGPAKPGWALISVFHLVGSKSFCPYPVLIKAYCAIASSIFGFGMLKLLPCWCKRFKLGLLGFYRFSSVSWLSDPSKNCYDVENG